MRINERFLGLDENRIKLILGLGNPGIKYRNTRHNLGANVVERIAREYRVRLRTSRSLKSKIAFCEIKGQICLLAFPQTYMNRSGEAVKRIIKEKNIGLKDILVIYDELDLDFGILRFRRRGNPAGHNGMQSIIDTLGNNEFNRLRLGIGKPKNKDLIVDYVLSNFSKKEKKAINLVIQESVNACKVWIECGIDKAMNNFNKTAL